MHARARDSMAMAIPWPWRAADRSAYMDLQLGVQAGAGQHSTAADKHPQLHRHAFLALLWGGGIPPPPHTHTMRTQQCGRHAQAQHFGGSAQLRQLCFTQTRQAHA